MLIKYSGMMVLEDGLRKGTVTINMDTGLIKDVSHEVRVDAVNFPDSALIFPGFGDLHVHCRQDESGKQNYKEDFTSAANAAQNGGVTFICDMPNNPIAPVTDERYERKKALIPKSSLVAIFLYAGIGPGTRPLLRDVFYKAYMGHSVGDLFFHSFAEMDETIHYYKGKNVSCHCDDQEILDFFVDAKTHERRRPAESEMSGIDQAIYYAEKYDLRMKVCHCSICGGLSKIRAAKKRGLKITCEVTPHHLFFDEEMLNDENRLWLQMNPPLRTRIDRLKLIEALRIGDIDYVASDHAPHTREEKLKGTSGVPLLDTCASTAVWLMDEHGFTPADIARVFAINPANFVNPYTDPEIHGKGFGKIEPGYMGSLTVIDRRRPSTITKEGLMTKCGWSPFEGMTFSGSLIGTILKGQFVPTNF